MNYDSKDVFAGKGGFGSFTERGGFEDIYVSYDVDILRYFLDGAKALIEELDMSKVESVLDVGTGTGHLALELAKRYPQCSVVGVDNSPGMLSRAEKKKGSLSNLTFMKHDWEKMESMQGMFDLVVNSFGACFVDNLDRFVVSVLSKMKPNGTFAFVNFEDGCFHPFGAELFSNLAEMSLLRTTRPPLSHANKTLIHFMKESGIVPHTIIDKQLEYPLANPEEWWTVVSRTAIKDHFFYDLSDEEIALFKDEHLKKVQNLIDKGFNKLVVAIKIVIGGRSRSVDN